MPYPGRLPHQVLGATAFAWGETHPPGSVESASLISGVALVILLQPIKHKATLRIMGVPILPGWEKSKALAVAHRILSRQGAV